jgi:hypothetical protein
MSHDVYHLFIRLKIVRPSTMFFTRRAIFFGFPEVMTSVLRDNLAARYRNDVSFILPPVVWNSSFRAGPPHRAPFSPSRINLPEQCANYTPHGLQAQNKLSFEINRDRAPFPPGHPQDTMT